MSSCCVWDFTVPEGSMSQKDIVAALKINCKAWAFQLEQGEGGFRHWQGRMNLKVKARMLGAKKVLCDEAHLSITSNANRDNTFYVLKAETRVEGPWSSEAPEKFVPWDVALMNELYPWQESVRKWGSERELRKIRVIYCPGGGSGKTSLARYLLVHGIGRMIPFANDYRDILRMICDMPTAPLYLVDMPRAISKDRLYQFWGAVESVKGGYAYDDRYKFREKIFDPPQVVVFTNTIPDRELMSADRWDLYEIKEKVLVPYQVPAQGATWEVVVGDANASVTLDDLNLDDMLLGS